MPPIRSVPEGYGNVTPWIISRETTRLIDFVVAAFDAEEIARVYSDDGSIGHAEVRIGDSIVMLFDAFEGWPDTPAFTRLYVDDGDVTFRQAVAAGAVVVTEMTELFFGDRVGRVCDPLGNVWWIQARVREVGLEEMGRLAQEPAAVEAMHYVQRSLDAHMRNRS